MISSSTPTVRTQYLPDLAPSPESHLWTERHAEVPRLARWLEELQALEDEEISIDLDTRIL